MDVRKKGYELDYDQCVPIELYWNHVQLSQFTCLRRKQNKTFSMVILYS